MIRAFERNLFFPNAWFLPIPIISNRENPLFMKMNSNKSVRREIGQCVGFLHSTKRAWCTSSVVASNHDNAYTRWVNEVSHFDEPNMDNAIFLLESQIELHKCARAGKRVNLFQWAAKQIDHTAMRNINFLFEDESYVVGNVEHGMHGDRGINGSRGSIKAFAKIGTKLTVGHSHSPSIFEGAYQNGCICGLQPDYAKGPSSWQHSSTIQYANGKRTLVTCIKGSYYAGQVVPAQL
jgi:hypothetical protein